MMIRSTPEWYDMLQTPREIVSGVSIDGLEQPEGYPAVYGEDMEIWSN